MNPLSCLFLRYSDTGRNIQARGRRNHTFKSWETPLFTITSAQHLKSIKLQNIHKTRGTNARVRINNATVQQGVRRAWGREVRRGGWQTFPCVRYWYTVWESCRREHRCQTRTQILSHSVNISFSVSDPTNGPTHTVTVFGQNLFIIDSSNAFPSLDSLLPSNLDSWTEIE